MLFILLKIGITTVLYCQYFWDLCLLVNSHVIETRYQLSRSNEIWTNPNKTFVLTRLFVPWNNSYFHARPMTNALTIKWKLSDRLYTYNNTKTLWEYIHVLCQTKAQKEKNIQLNCWTDALWHILSGQLTLKHFFSETKWGKTITYYRF